MDSITRFPAQMTATHPVVLLQMPDRRFNRLPTLEQLELFFVQPLRLASVIDLNARVLLIDPAVSEIDVHRDWLDSVVLQQDRRLLDLFSQLTPIKRITAKRSRTHHQVAVQRGRNADLGAKLVGRTRLAFVDTGSFRRMPAVDLRRRLALRRVPALYLAGSRLRDKLLRLGQRRTQRLFDRLAQRCHLRLDRGAKLAHDGALTANHLSHPFELPRMGIPPCLKPQTLTLLGEGLLERNLVLFGKFDQLAARNFKQTRVGWMRDRLGLNRGIDDDRFEMLRRYQFQLQRRVDGLRKQFLNAFLANCLAELDKRGGIAGQAVLKIGRTGEILPGGSFTPPLHHRLIALVEGVLQIQQRNQNTKRNSGATRRAGCRHDTLIDWPKQILALDLFTGADAAGQHRSDIRFQFLPGQSRGEDCQWVAQINHLIEAATEKIGGIRHRQNSQKIGGKVL